MEIIQDLQERFSSFMNSVSFDYRPVELYAPITYTLFQKGKRIRPMLCLLSCDLFGGDIDDALYPALALEVFHNSTLIHDDIMDQAPLRRGMETVYKKWNTDIAILSGDTMLALAFDFVLRTRNASEAARLLAQVHREVCEGQQYDLDFETHSVVSIPEYLEMIRLKTAVLLATSLKMGAIVAGAGDEDQKALYDFGIAIGMAFQIQDDLLDCYGDETVFGKKTGGDIVENKKTYLLLKALEVASAETRDDLLRWYAVCPSDPREKILAVRSLFDTLHVKEITEQVIADYFRKADVCLDAVCMPDDRKTALRDYSRMLLGRKY